ncbi:glycosyltransferase family 4 protein [Roseomonas terrae]|uniref:Glycosyltransferase family 4 protein n=1 Tax=Neoroseomonas terrae TaxID=424799 RepID=A0ABS5EGX3_9PROT|nr:glycosyltransferase family 4 protein [Neoroseomonas terrae]MBR0650225.1 glycosyltransferase family 4 protein [Neoroseomonas terrae]
MRTLFLAHNHPALQAGGTEAFALGLFRALRDGHGTEGLFLAGTTGLLRERRPGTLLQAVGGAADEMLVSLDHFDRFFLSQGDVYGLSSLGPMIERLDPDVVHLHHPLLWGMEGIDWLRHLLPRATMVATLHDYFLLCPREGQMLTPDGRLCEGPSGDACRRCFPERLSSDFMLRELGLRGSFAAFDALISPSSFLRDRFVRAGWPAERMHLLRNAVPAAEPAPHRDAPDGRRDRFAVFGNVNRFKGTLVALHASARLSAEGVAHGLAIHGGTAWQNDAFLAEFDAALAAAPEVRHQGAYAAGTFGARIAAADWVVVPSIWWENAPLVILEAFRHRRPVICGDIGGMAEAVRDGVDGLHAPVGDVAGLAAVMRRAAETPGLWDRLVAGIAPPPDLDAAAAAHLAFYRNLTTSAGRRRRAVRNRATA